MDIIAVVVHVVVNINMANTQTIKRLTESFKADMESTLQRAETTQDSLSQKLANRLGREDKLTKESVYVLKQIRRLQFRYFPVKTHSLLRYSDGSQITEKGKIIPNITKSNWRKYKKIKEREKLKKLL